MEEIELVFLLIEGWLDESGVREAEVSRKGGIIGDD